MVSLNLKDFLYTVPSTTEQFTRRLLQIMYAHDEIEVYNKKEHRKEIVTGKSAFPLILMKLYQDRINEISLDDYFDLDFSSLFNASAYNDPTIEKIYDKYSEFFKVYNTKEEYYFLTVEELLINAISVASNSNNQLIRTTLKDNDKFIKDIFRAVSGRRNKYRKEYEEKIYKDIAPQSIKYLDTASRISGLLDDVELSKDEISTLAYLLSFYYCENISEYKKVYDEQKIIIDYLDKKGINLSVIKEKLGVEINPQELEGIDPLLYYIRYLKGNFIKRASDCPTIGYLLKDFLEKCQGEAAAKTLFSNLNVSIGSLKDFEKNLVKEFYEKSKKSVDELYANLPLATKNAVHKINKIYTYLFTNRSKLNQDLVKGTNSVRTLAMVIALYDYDCDIKDFLVGKGLTLDKVLELVNIGPKEEFLKNLAQTEEFEKLVSGFYVMFYYYNNGNTVHKDITPVKLFNNLRNSDYVGSNIIQSMYSTINNKTLPNDYNSEIGKYIKKKNQLVENELSEKLLKNVSIDVFEYLKKVVSIYTNIDKNGTLNQADKEQLAIIIGAIEYDPKIKELFESLGLSITSLCKSFKLGDEFTNYSFSIKPIDGPLRKYIFDRNDNEITVYSILENAFKKELTNTLALRSVLYKANLEPEYFKDIKKLLEEYSIRKKQELRESTIVSLYGRISDDFNDTFIDILKIYERLNNIQNKDNRISIAIIMGLLLNNDEHSIYFNNNDIFLDTLLFYYNIDKSVIEGLKDFQYNKDIILDFMHIIAGREGLNSDDFIYYVFNNQNQTVTENLANFVKVPHNTIKCEVLYKQEKEITPEQGMRILSREELDPIDDLNIPNITEFGLTISEHFKYINNYIKELVFNDSLTTSVASVNELLNGIVVEEDIPKKNGIFSWLFDTGTVEDKIKKYNPDKVTDLNEVIDNYLVVLAKEIKGYNYLKKYIELYLVKLTGYLEYLKGLQNNYNLSVTEITSIDDILEYTKMLDQQSVKKVLEGKINAFETMIMVMKQELFTVHKSIINHFITINSLQISKNAIIPLLTTEIAIGMGNKTEAEAIKVSNGLIELLKSVVNNNLEIASSNLEMLKQTNIGDVEFQKLSIEVNNYLASAFQGQTLLDNLTPDEGEEKTRTK